jgi:chemotaxis protein CheD
MIGRGLHDAGPGRVIHILIGQVHVARPPHVLFAVLGSCIGVAILDRASGIGGMAHVLLPESRGHAEAGMPGKYADVAVDCLVLSLTQVGADSSRLVSFVAGGAALCSEGDPHAGIGRANAAVTMLALKRLGIPIAESAIGGKAGRKVTLHTGERVFRVEALGTPEHLLKPKAV